MRNSFLVGAAALATVFASPALAQDTYEDDTPFAGVYVGGAVSYDAQPNDIGERVAFDRNLDGSFADNVLTPTGANAFAPGFCNGAATASTRATGCRNDKDNIGYSVRAGVDFQTGPIVFGVLGEFGKSEIRDSVTAFSSTPAFYTLTREVSFEAAARARAGVAANTTLFYGTAGVGYLRIDNSFTTSNTANTFTSNGKQSEFGLLAGGGIEQKIGRNFSIGLEYLYHQYEDNEYRVRAGGAAGTPFTNATNGGTADGTDFLRTPDKFRWHSARAVAAFRF